MAEPAEVRRKRAQRVLRRLIEPARRARIAPVEIRAHHVHGEPISFAEAARATYEPFEVGDRWGSAWDTTWFRVRGTVPSAWRDEKAVLVVHLGYGGATGFGAEGLVWWDGQPVQGISPNHREVPVLTGAGDAFELFIEAAANPTIDPFADPAPLYLPDPGGRPTLRLNACHLAVVEGEVDSLWHDWTVLCELYDDLDSDSPRAAQILRALDVAADTLDPGAVVETAGSARSVLAPMLARPAAASAHTYAAVGNAHIDTAWLWPLRETERKCARTFSTALSLIERYPDFRFAASQPQQFAWVRDRYPELFERIRKAVADGRFEPVGAMWVEADCNIPSGESLVRQIVHGKRFFRDEFGVESDTLWLPDVFGYPAALPQILRRSGIEWFLTQKLSWNQVNRFPHHTFLWQGLDGSRVFTHFPPADTYNGSMSVAELNHGARNYSEKAISDRSLYLYGWGDGGGGPTSEMLERAARVADLEGVARVELTGARAGFEAVAAATDLEALPVWVGELYFEMHRGTYTTHAEVKRGNRKLELALRDAELWSLAASAAGLQHPTETLDSAWKRLLLHQFHDIIPGSSIHWVYDDTARDYAELASVTSKLIDRALTAVGEAVDVGGARRPVLVANSLGFAREEVVDVDGEPRVLGAPPCGWTVQDLDDPPESAFRPLEYGDGWMDNGVLRVAWDADGLLTSVFHHATSREALAAGARGNLLQVHRDRPNVYDAWDVDAAAFNGAVDVTEAETVEMVESSADRGAVRVVRRWRSSTIEQVIVLARGSRRVEFRTKVDWRESHELLKAAFPLDVHSDEFTCEVQFGHVRRPTHRNTSWDEARFEVCAHTWVDMSEHGFGVALLNDCKYGHDAVGNVLRLTLLRSPTHPDPLADKGAHEFAYALMPHAGDHASGGVAEEAHAFNSPLRVVPLAGGGGPLPPQHSVVDVHGEGFVVTAVKRADDGEGWIVRGYEAFGGRRTVALNLSGAGSAVACDLLEQPSGPALARDGDRFVLPLAPFEIVTLRVDGR